MGTAEESQKAAAAASQQQQPLQTSDAQQGGSSQPLPPPPAYSLPQSQANYPGVPIQTMPAQTIPMQTVYVQQQSTATLLNDPPVMLVDGSNSVMMYCKHCHNNVVSMVASTTSCSGPNHFSLPTMKQTHLGTTSNPLVSALGFGAMGLSEFYGATDESESLATLKHALDIGCTFWDTSDMYGSGHNEELIGKFIKMHQCRDKVFVCTKFGIVRHPTMGLDSSPAYVRSACEASLKRLGIECIDLYYQHRVDPKTPIEDTMRALVTLVNEGKIKHIGLSEASAATIRRAHAIHPIAAYQVEYSPWTTEIEHNDILATCNELGIAVIAYSPLGRGFLTGRFRSPEDFEEGDYRKGNPRFQGDAFAKNLEIVKALEKLAEDKKCSVAQLTLAWVMAQGPCVIPIPGTKSIKRLDENCGSLNVTITPEDNKAVRDIIAQIPVTGTRYDARGMTLVNA
ncbi:hypothetical protein HDU98_007619 [Podochytrium sp. JEL0797]|nr:hypothetical protein HDU98_007619 [Podochytrium sp. JEL0797]